MSDVPLAPGALVRIQEPHSDINGKVGIVLERHTKSLMPSVYRVVVERTVHGWISEASLDFIEQASEEQLLTHSSIYVRNLVLKGSRHG